MLWFERLAGFKEKRPEQVRDQIEIIDNELISKVNNRRFVFGKLETPSLEFLRQENDIQEYNSRICLSEVVGDIQEIHQDEPNNRSVIQVASQFNLLEMVHPDKTPEDGVGIYEYDATQGPACAIACGAGTIYRNYFADVNGQPGQTTTNQIDCLHDIGLELGNDTRHLWKMKNGYALASRDGLKAINKIFQTLSESDYESLKGNLRVGVQWDSEVTLSNTSNFITQVYCSALPVAYSHLDKALWRNFAMMILEASYEATILVALKNFRSTGNNALFLTMLGGGAFGNERDWIFRAIEKAVMKYARVPLDLKIVSYGTSHNDVQEFIASVKRG